MRISILVYTYAHACICIRVLGYVYGHLSLCIWDMKFILKVPLSEKKSIPHRIAANIAEKTQ